MKSVQNSGPMIYTTRGFVEPFASEAKKNQSERHLATHDKIRNQFANRDERGIKSGSALGNAARANKIKRRDDE